MLIALEQHTRALKLPILLLTAAVSYLPMTIWQWHAIMHFECYIQCEYTACMHIPVSTDRGRVKPMETSQF